MEAYIQKHSQELKLDSAIPELVPTCQLWRDPKATPYYHEMHAFLSELEDYYKRIEAFRLDEGITDVRQHIHDGFGGSNICQKLKLREDGLEGIFSESKQLSRTRSGWAEPIMPPMRHPKFCLDGASYLLNIQYIVHDFQAMCESLRPTSKTVFVDMGASLMFHRGQQSPVLDIIDMFQKFGIKFDHIYAYEKTRQNPNHVYNRIPPHLYASYHWMNVGVAAETDSPLNPWNMLLENYSEDDLVIVKLDVDTPDLERQLAQQLLDHPQLSKLIDHFYFEHHVNQQELARNWGPTKQSVKESLDLFKSLREKGVAAHFWV
mgnify:CR=1 FL=1